MMRILFVFSAAVMSVFIAAILVFWTPNTDAELMRAKYGGEDARYATSAAGMQIHYRVSGPADAPVLVLIHGTAASLHTWEPLRARLEQRFRVIAYDQPGHGLTGPHPRRDYTYQGMREGLDAVFLAEGIEQAVLVGNSMGGWVAWRDALDNPARVKGLVLIDAAGIPDDIRPDSNLGFRILKTAAGRLAMRRLTPRNVVEQSIKDTVVNDDLVDEAMVARYWELLRYPGNRVAAGDQHTSPRADLSARLPEIDVPTLIIWGEEDRLISVRSADMFERYMPNARAVTYADIGHLPMEEAPARVARDISDFMEANFAGVPLAPIGEARDIPQ